MQTIQFALEIKEYNEFNDSFIIDLVAPGETRSGELPAEMLHMLSEVMPDSIFSRAMNWYNEQDDDHPSVLVGQRFTHDLNITLH